MNRRGPRGGADPYKTSIFVSGGSEYWFRSGLGRSAFKSVIYGGLPLDFYLNGIDATKEYYHIAMKDSSYSGLIAHPKFYMFHDAYLMFYQDYMHVARSVKNMPKKKSLWWSVIRKVITTSDYLELNRVTARSSELAALAGAKFLKNLLMKTYSSAIKEDIGKDAVKWLDEGPSDDLEKIIPWESEITNVLNRVLEDVKKYMELKGDVDEAVGKIIGMGGSGYSHEALSVLHFLKNPDDFRKKVVITRLAAIMMGRLLPQIPTSMSHQQTVSTFGGVTGVSRMLRESQIKDLLPHELAILRANNVPDHVARTLFAYKIMQRQVAVLERAAALKPTVFIDKSGSMSGNINYSDNIPKISLACGFALALYRKLDADVYLFDTEVDKVGPKEVVKYLLTLKASGGTDITEVLNEIMRIGKKDRPYIIITDGIDIVDQGTIDMVRRAGLINRVRFVLVPPASEERWLKENFKYEYVENIVDFMESVKRTLSLSM